LHRGENCASSLADGSGHDAHAIFVGVTLDASGTLIVADRRSIQAVAVVSIIMLAVTVLVRPSAPPFAPRVHVRWADGISDEQRLLFERSLALVNGQLMENRTWQYDLMDAAPSAVRGLVGHPAVADTHHIDRVRGVVSAEAPRGTARLADTGMASAIRSPWFDWVVSFWVAALAVSGAWLVSAEHTRVS
jgi:hypothetical protein